MDRRSPWVRVGYQGFSWLGLVLSLKFVLGCLFWGEYSLSSAVTVVCCDLVLLWGAR